jgi:hypothetical protein
MLVQTDGGAWEQYELAPERVPSAAALKNGALEGQFFGAASVPATVQPCDSSTTDMCHQHMFHIRSIESILVCEYGNNNYLKQNTDLKGMSAVALQQTYSHMYHGVM